MWKYFYVYIVALLPYNIFLESMFKDILQRQPLEVFC